MKLQRIAICGAFKNLAPFIYNGKKKGIPADYNGMPFL
jgi:hypothetical protein